MAILGRISNPANDQIRAAIAIRDRRRARARERRFFVEGVRLVRQGILAGSQPCACYVTDALGESVDGADVLERLSATQVWFVTDEVMATLADTVSPQGIVALFPLPAGDLERLAPDQDIIVLDAVADPGNVGTILRTAQAAGIGVALLSKGCADPHDPKVVRAAMGAHFGLPIYAALPWTTIEASLAKRQRVLADIRGDVAPWSIDWRRPSAAIVSSEASGPSAEARAAATFSVRLPMSEAVESLNAAIAAAQMLYEMQRQRLTSPAGR